MMPGRGPRRTGLSVWRRSTDKGSVAATPAEPRFDAGPPSSPPPAHAPGQRRLNFLIVGLTILLSAGLVGTLLFFSGGHPKYATAPPSEARVRQGTQA